MPDTILIVDNASGRSRMIEYVVRKKLSYHVITVGGSGDVSQWISSGRQPQPDLILLDLAMPDTASLNLIREVRASHPQLPVIALVPYGDDNCAGHAMRAGASDFLTKPVTLERLRISLRNTLTLKHMGNTILRLERYNTGHACFSDIIGRSAAIKEALAHAQTAIHSRLPVWIEGEAGTGKELLARAIHGSGNYAGAPFVTVDCKELPDEMAEAIFFGREEAHGDPVKRFIRGKVREAEKGTLFLKGIGSLSAKLQNKLLDMLNEGIIRSVGTAKPVAVDVRVMVAVYRPIKPLLIEETFHPALCRRLQETFISMPALRERRDDIGLLARHFIIAYSASEGRSMVGLNEEARQHLAGASWPGNIHQLSRLMWQAVMLCNQEILDHGNLRLIEQWQPAYYKEYGDAMLPAASPLLFDCVGKIKKLRSIEDDIIKLALQHNNGCMTRAARQLGIGRSTLYRRVGELEKDGYISRENQATRPMMSVSSADRS